MQRTRHISIVHDIETILKLYRNRFWRSWREKIVHSPRVLYPYVFPCRRTRTHSSLLSKTVQKTKQRPVCMYVCIVSTFNRVWIDRVWLSILLVVSCTLMFFHADGQECIHQVQQYRRQHNAHSIRIYVCMYGQHFQQSVDQPFKVANPARSELNRVKNIYITIPVRD